MGFMDKAKKLAEQAQQKLDEAQKNFNQSGSPQAQPGEGGTRYDEHGRPIEDAPPAGATPPPAADPTTPVAADPTAPPPADPTTPVADPAAPGGEAAAPAPPPDPASPSPPPDPASEGDPAGTENDPAGTESHPAGPEPTRQPETGQSGGGQANQAPDPFKPLQQ
jgi:hypothetical protein